MGKLAEIKTKQTEASVEGFIQGIDNEQKRKDSLTLLQLMQAATGEQPKIWGTGLIGFGKVRMKSPATSREVEWFLVGFAPRKSNLSIYVNNTSAHEALLKKLGKYKTGMGCLYVNKLADIDLSVLEKIINDTVKAGDKIFDRPKS